jgi:hypothetical protein
MEARALLGVAVIVLGGTVAWLIRLGLVWVEKIYVMHGAQSACMTVVAEKLGAVEAALNYNTEAIRACPGRVIESPHLTKVPIPKGTPV